jgi:hypothetical protein
MERLSPSTIYSYDEPPHPADHEDYEPPNALAIDPLPIDAGGYQLSTIIEGLKERCEVVSND